MRKVEEKESSLSAMSLKKNSKSLVLKHGLGEGEIAYVTWGVGPNGSKTCNG